MKCPECNEEMRQTVAPQDGCILNIPWTNI